MEKTRRTKARGAFGLEMPDGSKEMIDEPMVKQVSCPHSRRVARFGRGPDLGTLAGQVDTRKGASRGPLCPRNMTTLHPSRVQN